MGRTPHSYDYKYQVNVVLCPVFATGSVGRWPLLSKVFGVQKRALTQETDKKVMQISIVKVNLS